jgi:ABC-type multidrug transport system fused ATPase/permease subunit
VSTEHSGAARAAAPPAYGKPSQREQERALDAQASLLDTDTDIGLGEALRIIRRGVGLLQHFWGRFLAKFLLNLGALAVPVLLLPWPVKLAIDHVVLARPIESATGYPGFMLPVLHALRGATPGEILVWLSVFAFSMVVLVGGFAPGGATQDTTEASMEEGHDHATRQENMTHGGHSFVGGLWGMFEFALNSRLTQSVNHFLRTQLFERIRSMPMATLEDMRTGDAVYRVMYDTPAVNTIFYEVILTPVLSTITFLIALATLLSAYPHLPQVAWFAMAVFPAYLLVTAPFTRMLRRRDQASRAAGTIATSTIEEGMDNMVAVQSLGGSAQERKRFAASSAEAFRRFRSTVLLGVTVFNLGGLMDRVVFAGVIWFVTGNIIDGNMSPGDYGALLFYFGWMQGPALSLATLWIRLQVNIAGMRRVYALMDMPQETDMGRRALPRIEHGVEFREAGLVHRDGRRAFGGVTFQARIGEVVALVGPTGAGKTTLAQLIPRYRVATEGEVLIDGVDVRDATLSSLRDQVTYVFQETQLFSDSIRENIRFGRPDASAAEVERAARTAGAHEFIAALPDGYDTRLGTTNARLSVGQKQRIAIARGLLRDARILILDEPTSALDPETERALVRTLRDAARDRLVLIIAHRLSTIAHADKIVFMAEGCVLEQGSHDDLMALPNGHYRRYVGLQAMQPG